jgi:hypothetical protein
MYPLTLERAAKMHFMHSKNISDTMKQVEEVQIMTDFHEVSTLLTLELNPLPLQLKVVLPGLEGCVFSVGI